MVGNFCYKQKYPHCINNGPEVLHFKTILILSDLNLLRVYFCYYVLCPWYSYQGFSLTFLAEIGIACSMAVHLQYFFNISLLEAFILNWKKNKEKIRVCVSSDRHIYTHIYEWIHWQQWNCTIIKWDIHLLMAELLGFPNTWSEGGWETIKDVPFSCPQTVSFWDTI